MATIVLAAVGLIAAGVSAYAAVEAGQQAEATGRANQKIARQQAVFAQQSADVASAQERERTRRAQGAAAAMIGAAGVQPEGSPLLTMIENAQQSELNARLIQASANRSIYADIAAGNIAAFEGQQAATGGYFKAGSTLLSGAYTVGSRYYGSGSGDGSGGGGAGRGSAPAPARYGSD